MPIQRLLEKYKKEVIPAMMEKFGYKTGSAVPKIEKVLVNTGFGRLTAGKTSDEQKKTVEAIVKDLASITGQAPVVTKAKKSIATFKTREGMVIGAVVTLRKKKMFDFLDRVISIGLPRSRDFRGLESKSFDNQGNFTLGIREHIIFPEISPEQVRIIFGFEIIIVTTAKGKEEGLWLLKFLGFPIK